MQSRMNYRLFSKVQKISSSVQKKFSITSPFLSFPRKLSKIRRKILSKGSRLYTVSFLFDEWGLTKWRWVKTREARRTSSTPCYRDHFPRRETQRAIKTFHDARLGCKHNRFHLSEAQPRFQFRWKRPRNDTSPSMGGEGGAFLPVPLSV